MTYANIEDNISKYADDLKFSGIVDSKLYKTTEGYRPGGKLVRALALREDVFWEVKLVWDIHNTW